MVGYGSGAGRANVIDVDRVGTEGTVHPEWRGRGLGAALLPWMIRRAGEVHAERHPEVDGEVNTGAISTNTGAHDLLTSHGFEECRYFFHMHRTFDTAVPEVTTPEGLRVVAYDPSYDQSADGWLTTRRSWTTGDRRRRTRRPGRCGSPGRARSVAMSAAWSSTATRSSRTPSATSTSRTPRRRGSARSTSARSARSGPTGDAGSPGSLWLS